ncbi:hypothetical protein pdam_00022254 [Pocillopora damicornis]|uniref:G-protein coupled receptors family 1 profile domain-containing protein n=1 Tax=Pocillopora damicornis TaxID=46731 RepID=A0A3M6U0J8_POCDA|nr:hypothetical protein pdam_00022254 [Pocillopora damicornis]
MIVRAKTQYKASAVKWVALITCVFLSCYKIYMRYSLLFLIDQSCNDFHYKIPLQVINSGINPIAYAFFKRDIQQECKRLLFKRRLNVSFAPKPKNLSFLKRWLILVLGCSLGIDYARTMRGYLYLLFEIILCTILIFFLASMFFVVYNLNYRDRTLAKQLRFNQLITRAKTQNMSARYKARMRKASVQKASKRQLRTKTNAFVMSLAVADFGVGMIACNRPCQDYTRLRVFAFRDNLVLINSGINPIAYAFFKRDIQQECKRLLSKRRR